MDFKKIFQLGLLGMIATGFFLSSSPSKKSLPFKHSEAYPVIPGKVIPLTYEGNIGSGEGMEIKIMGEGEFGSLTTQADGSFAIDAGQIRSNQFEICVNPKNQDYYPSCIQEDINGLLDMSLMNQQLNFLLVPKKWKLKGDIYDDVIDIDLIKPFDYSGSLNLSDSFYIMHLNDVISIPLQNRPLKTFIHQPSAPDSTVSQDSIKFWSAIEEMEKLFGLGQFFSPASRKELKDIKCGVEVNFKGEFNSRTGRGGSHIDNNNNHIVGGSILLGNQPDKAVIIHEALHVMGLGHTCRWETIMVRDGCTASEENSGFPTKYDVGYTQLLYRIRDIQHQKDISYGISDAYRAMNPDYKIDENLIASQYSPVSYSCN